MDERVIRHLERNEGKFWGKYRGLVVDRDDPEQVGRLRLEVPSLLQDAITGWAWPAAPYAGGDLGFCFVPQVGDLVWVEFAEGDLEHPLWTGCGWAKPDDASEIPTEAQDGYPDVGVLKTRSGNIIIMSDQDGSEQITIRTKSGCEIVLDGASSKVTIVADEILLQGSAGDVQPLATEAFVTQIFDTHTHPTGVGPSGPPTLTSSTNPRSLTSIVKAE